MPGVGARTQSISGQSLNGAEIMSLAWLLRAARDCTGLNVLLMLGQDPMMCDTAKGFAMRLNRPVAEVEAALAHLQECGVLCSSKCIGACQRVSYWLAEDPHVMFVLRRLVETYMSGASHRGDLLKGLPAFQTA
ncbi:MAG: hypothetical protein HPY44_08305 [Armatimonadetes bacterium]|nr:hypothetical protein [Armatimonadota bacterium]